MDVPAVRDQRLLMTNMRGIDSPVIAEHAIALLLALAHGLDRFALDTSQGVMNRANAGRIRMQFLEGKTMLVAGLGGIGTEIAKRASGLGMEVVATRQGGSGKPDFVRYVGQPDELLKLARDADVIVCALPLTPETTGLFNAEFFAVLKPSAYFINIARGGSVVTADLVAALDAGKLAGAGLDVTEPEPLPADHPLWKSPRVLITPHISSSFGPAGRSPMDRGHGEHAPLCGRRTDAVGRGPGARLLISSGYRGQPSGSRRKLKGASSALDHLASRP